MKLKLGDVLEHDGVWCDGNAVTHRLSDGVIEIKFDELPHTRIVLSSDELLSLLRLAGKEIAIVNPPTVRPDFTIHADDYD